MKKEKNTATLISYLRVMVVAGQSFSPASLAAQSPARNSEQTGQPAIAKRIGAIKAINGNALTLAADSLPRKSR